MVVGCFYDGFVRRLFLHFFSSDFLFRGDFYERGFSKFGLLLSFELDPSNPRNLKDNKTIKTAQNVQNLRVQREVFY